MATRERFWTRRLRWRMRGAWVWPAFAALTALDALLLVLLPPVRTGVDAVPAVLVATFGNLLLVGLVAPWLARRLERRERAADEAAPPFEVLASRAATGLLALGALGLLAAGLAARPLVVSETRDTEAAARAIGAYVERQGSAEERRNLDTANTLRLAEDYFRICIALDDRRLASCFFVETDRRPPRVVRDRDARPNALIAP